MTLGASPLKITRIETVIVNAVHRNWIFVKVLTDQPGLHGWGEATLEWKTRAVKGAIDDLAPFVIGAGSDAHRTPCEQDDSLQLLASGLDRADGCFRASSRRLWDIKGKELWACPSGNCWAARFAKRCACIPIWGAARSGFQVPNSDIGAYCDAVQKTVEMGYDAVKLGFVPVNGYDAPIKAVRHTEKLARAVRERVGDNVDIMVDFHGRPDSLDAAIAYVNAIAPIKPLFCEEVIQPGDARAMADIARRVDCPLATGERLFTPREFADIAEARAVAYIQPDLAHCMGFSGGRKIAAIAEAAHMGVCPHNPMGPVAGAVALNFDVATTNFVIQEEAVGIVPVVRGDLLGPSVAAQGPQLDGAGGAGSRHRDRRSRCGQASVRAGNHPRNRFRARGRTHRELVAPGDHTHTPANKSRSIVRAQKPR